MTMIMRYMKIILELLVMINMKKLKNTWEMAMVTVSSVILVLFSLIISMKCVIQPIKYNY